MNKAQLVEKVANSTNQSKLVTKQILEGFLDSIGESLCEGRKIEIRGFGSFKVKQRKARVTRNPRTGEQITIPALKVAKFRAGRGLKEKLS